VGFIYPTLVRPAAALKEFTSETIPAVTGEEQLVPKTPLRVLFIITEYHTPNIAMSIYKYRNDWSLNQDNIRYLPGKPRPFLLYPDAGVSSVVIVLKYDVTKEVCQEG
jgi:hypothetical protein